MSWSLQHCWSCHCPLQCTLIHLLCHDDGMIRNILRKPQAFLVTLFCLLVRINHGLRHIITVDGACFLIEFEFVFVNFSFLLHVFFTFAGTTGRCRRGSLQLFFPVFTGCRRCVYTLGRCCPRTASWRGHGSKSFIYECVCPAATVRVAVWSCFRLCYSTV